MFIIQNISVLMIIRILVILICMLMKISTFASNESLNPRMERCTLADYQNNDKQSQQIMEQNSNRLRDQLINMQLIGQQRKSVIQNIEASKLFKTNYVIHYIANFIYKNLKSATICILLLAICLLIIHKSRLIKSNEDKVNIFIKIKQIAVVLSFACVLLIIIDSIQGIRIINRQEYEFSELSCLLQEKPELLIYKGQELSMTLADGEAKFSLNQLYEHQSLKEVDLFFRHNLDVQQNLRLSQFIRNSTSILNAPKAYIQQLDEFISILQSTNEQIKKIQMWDFKRLLLQYFTTHILEFKMVTSAHRVLSSSRIYHFAYIFEKGLVWSCFFFGIALAVRKISFYYKSQNGLISLYFVGFLFISFLVLSILVLGTYWLHDRTSDLGQLGQISMMHNTINKINNGIFQIFPRYNSSNLHKIIINPAKQYQIFFNKIGNKQNDYYNNFYKQSLQFLEASEQQKVEQKINSRHFKQLQLIPRMRLVGDFFRTVIKTIPSDESQESRSLVFSRYMLELMSKLMKVILINIFPLRNLFERLFYSFLSLLFLNYLANLKYENTHNYEQIISPASGLNSQDNTEEASQI